MLDVFENAPGRIKTVNELLKFSGKTIWVFNSFAVGRRGDPTIIHPNMLMTPWRVGPVVQPAGMNQDYNLVTDYADGNKATFMLDADDLDTSIYGVRGMGLSPVNLDVPETMTAFPVDSLFVDQASIEKWAIVYRMLVNEYEIPRSVELGNGAVLMMAKVLALPAINLWKENHD